MLNLYNPLISQIFSEAKKISPQLPLQNISPKISLEYLDNTFLLFSLTIAQEKYIVLSSRSFSTLPMSKSSE